jgi:hypothetical protein
MAAGKTASRIDAVHGLGLIEPPGQYLTFNEDFRGSTVALTAS